MKRILLAFLAAIILTFPNTTFAQEKASASSAKIVSKIEVSSVFDNRVQILRAYLLQRNSPLAYNASDFINYADEHSLDWRLVAAIAGVESSYGLAIPYNSYNAWGWGVYGDNVIRFKSWAEGIEIISKGLRVNYLKENPQSDPYFIGPTYAASPTWAQRVAYFMQRIEDYRIKNAKSALALAL